MNVHTVAKAYQLLEREGLLHRQRGEAFRVAETGQLALELLRREVQDLVARAEALGVSPQGLLELLEEVVREGSRRKA